MLIAVLFTGNAFPQNGAMFSFNETAHDFGEVGLDSPLHCTFEFTNSGNAPLIITGIEPTCHCVSAVWTRGVIAPGAKGTVEVTYAAPLQPGRFDRGLFIGSNATNVDPSIMRYELRVRGVAVEKAPEPVKKATSRTKRRGHKR